jgi:hypothetical protein
MHIIHEYMMVKNHTLIPPRICFFHAVEEGTQDGAVTDGEVYPLYCQAPIAAYYTFAKVEPASYILVEKN